MQEHIKEQSERVSGYTTDSITVIVSTSLALLIVSLILALVISNIIKRTFAAYRDNIHHEVENSKAKDRLIFEQTRKAAMGELIGVIAHQLKQPLNTITVNKDLLIDDYNYGELDEAALHEFDDVISRQVNFMAASIDELKDFFNPNKPVKPFSVREAIESGLSIIGKSISGKGIELTTDFRRDALLTGIDNEFQQVILNIVNNAKDALEEKSTEGAHIRLSTDVEDDILLIEICDNGGGVDPEIIDKVFDSYFTTKGKKGTGIGLNLSRMIIEESFSGTIRVRNTDEGACFTIVLPLTAERSSEQPDKSD